MKFIKIKNHLINLERTSAIVLDGLTICFSGVDRIYFSSEPEAEAIYEKIIKWINGSYGGISANGTIPDLTKE